jgi:hypothetical protein
MRKVRSGPDKENSVGVDKPTDRGNVNLVMWGIASYEVNFDAEILAGLAKCSVRGLRKDPESNSAYMGF